MTEKYMQWSIFYLTNEIKAGGINLSRFIRLGDGNRTENIGIKIGTSYSLS